MPRREIALIRGLCFPPRSGGQKGQKERGLESGRPPGIFKQVPGTEKGWQETRIIIDL